MLDPLRVRAIDFLQTGMDTGEIRKQDPAMLLFTLYTAVVGSLTEASVLNVVVGADKGRASLKRREREVISFVRAAMLPPPSDVASVRISVPLKRSNADGEFVVAYSLIP